MSRARSWRDLKVGAAALALVVAGAATVLAFARVGALRGDTIRLYAITPHARGILPGSEVWLAGRQVGLVRAVGFRPPSTDTTLRVLLTLDVLAAPSASIRRTADVSIRAGGSLIGAPVVAIAPATTSVPAVQNGDTLVAAPQSELASIRTRLTTTVGTEVPVILDNVRVLGAQLETARGTLGALGVEGPRRIGTTGRAASALLARATRGRGTVTLALGGGELSTRARAVLARVDSLRALAAAPGGTVGSLRTDSTFRRSLESARIEVGRVQALIEGSRGTAGRAQRDRILQRELARARTELDLIFADLRRNPLRYFNP